MSVREPEELFAVDETFPPRDLFDAGNAGALAILQNLNELSRRHQGLVRAGIEPREAPAHDFDVGAPPLGIDAIDVGDSELAARRGSQGSCNVDDIAIVEVEPRDCVVRLGYRRFLFDGEHGPVGVELHYPVELRIANAMGEKGASNGACARGSQQVFETCANENIVPEDE